MLYFESSLACNRRRYLGLGAAKAAFTERKSNVQYPANVIGNHHQHLRPLALKARWGFLLIVVQHRDHKIGGNGFAAQAN